MGKNDILLTQTSIVLMFDGSFLVFFFFFSREKALTRVVSFYFKQGARN